MSSSHEGKASLVVFCFSRTQSNRVREIEAMVNDTIHTEDKEAAVAVTMINVIVPGRITHGEKLVGGRKVVGRLDGMDG
jgi:hypothetical protein